MSWMTQYLLSTQAPYEAHWPWEYLGNCQGSIETKL
jgi:hypothetical protein